MTTSKGTEWQEGESTFDPDEVMSKMKAKNGRHIPEILTCI